VGALWEHWGGFGVALESQSVAYQHALRWLWGRIGVALTDRPPSESRFWAGELIQVGSPRRFRRVAVAGLGGRQSCAILAHTLRSREAELDELIARSRGLR
jgi:hypothetical protein